MTKEERLEQFKRDTLSGYSRLDPAILSLIHDAFARGYNEGFADGCAAGASHTAKTMEFVNEKLFGGRA